MNCAQFKNPLCYLCVASAVVVFWSLAKKVAGLNNLFKLKMIIFLSMKTIEQNTRGKLKRLGAFLVFI